MNFLHLVVQTKEIMKYILPFLALIFLFSCKSSETSMDSGPKLTKAEKAAGWQMLFDGKSMAGWHGYNEEVTGPAWRAIDGSMYLDKSLGKAGDIVTDEQYEDFELMLEWKIQDCGNSGIFWNVVEDPSIDRVYKTGAEMQVLDNKCHPDAKIRTHRSGDLYDMIESSVETVKPAGQWNSVKIRSKNAAMELWQNGVKVVSFTMHTPEWDAMVAGSKFKSMTHFGKAKKGHIALQDHGDEVWFRNIKIRRL